MPIQTDKARLAGKKLIFTIIFLFSGLAAVSQQMAGSPVSPPLEKQYEQLISEALRLQVTADSLLREASQLRRNLPAMTDPLKRRSAEEKILELESRGFRIQGETDEKYKRAREIELKLISARQKERILVKPEKGCPEISFLFIADINAACFLPEKDIRRLENLEEEFDKANRLLKEAAVIDEKIEKNREILDDNPRRRIRRRTERENEELEERYLSKMEEAMLAFEIISFIRYKAYNFALEYLRSTVSDPYIITRGLALEEKASREFLEASERRQKSGSLKSREYLEEYLVAAHNYEKKAFSFLERACNIYAGNLETVADLDPDETQTEFGFDILPYSPYSVDNPIPFDISLPDGPVYRIQLGIYLAPMGEQLFGGMAPLSGEYIPARNSYKYYAGMFRSIDDAEKALTDIRRKGFRDAFIVAWHDGRTLPVNRAASLERREHVVEVADEVKKTSVEQPEDTAEEATNSFNGIVFKVQVGVFSDLLNTETHRLFSKAAGSRNLEYRKNNQGYYVYSIGNFNTFEEALLMQKQLNAQGMTDAFVVAYRGDERISVEDAKKAIQQ